MLCSFTLRTNPMKATLFSRISRMGSETGRRVSLEEPAYGGENEIDLQHNESSPPSTYSMVTVRLSDAMFEFPAAEVAHGLVEEDSAGHEIPKRESKQELVEEVRSIKDSEYHSFQSLDDDLNEALPKNGASRASRSIVDGKSSRFNSDAFRSRSNSSRTSSSAASAQVDWDELDKSEEQAPRDECSDEVCTNWTKLITAAFSDLAQVNCISPGQT